MLTIADGGGGGIQEPLILADVICEQPLTAFERRLNWGNTGAGMSENLTNLFNL